ncbi:MAG: phosphate acetyltransferase [Treponema sp.]|nr:phosphate acetyltransferase [Treponema sp.]
MGFLELMMEKARKNQKKLVLTEGSDPKTIRAARQVLDQSLASSVVLLGTESQIKKNAAKEGVSISDMEIINPELSKELDKYATEYYELRKLRGMTREQAKIDIIAPLRWGAMMVHLGKVDAMVGGAEDNYIDVFFAGLAIIGTAPNIRTASSCIVIQTEDTSWGVNGAFIFSDCSVVPNPLPDQLSDIAQCAAQSCRDYLEAEPVVALLSHSTKGLKRNNSDLEKVRNTLDMVKEKEPGLVIDGEIQVESALIPSVTDIRAPNSPVRGRVNTLVFPDMDAGNIGYQLVRSFAKAQTFGPFLQGFAKPISFIPQRASAEKVMITCVAVLARAK